MNTSNTDKLFAGSIPKLYDAYMVPMIFESYAVDLVTRLKSNALTRVLEVAAGTGVVTRAMATVLPDNVSLVATDLNQAMIDHAMSVGTHRAVDWRQADAMQLAFPDATFDAVVCQFGAMFFPDKVKAFAEIRRVLKPSGVFLFNVWDRVEENEFANVVMQALATLFPDDPPRFIARTPHGYYDRKLIESDLAAAGFDASINFDTVTAQSCSPSAEIVAMAYCQGTPVRNEIDARKTVSLEHATHVVAEAITKQFGAGPLTGKIQAHVINAKRV